MEETKKPEPAGLTPDEQAAKMAARLARVEAEHMAIAAGCVDSEAIGEVVEKIVPHLRSEVDETGEVKTRLVDSGNELWIDKGQFVDQLKTKFPHLFVKQAKPAPAPPEKVEAERNPWLPEFFNVTEQGRLIRNSPEYAARLQAAARGQMANNPFSREGMNLTAQARMLRENPELAQKMKQQAEGPEPNPWMLGPTFNLTSQCLMMRRDATKAARLKEQAAAFNASYKKPTTTMPIFKARPVRREGE